MNGSTPNNVEDYLPLVRAVMRSMRLPQTSSFDADDLYQSGCIGLLDAWRRFDPSQGLKFETFASHRIRGAILDQIRSMDHLSRSHREMVAAGKEYDPLLKGDITDYADVEIEEEWEVAEGDLEVVGMAIDDLTEQERHVVRLTAEGLYRHQVGDHLWVGAARVSQLREVAIDKLNKAVNGKKKVFPLR